MKKVTLIIALAMATGVYSCAPKYTCPAYAKSGMEFEKTTQLQQKPM